MLQFDYNCAFYRILSKKNQKQAQLAFGFYAGQPGQ